MPYIILILQNGSHHIVKYLLRKGASSIFRYKTKDGICGEVNGIDIASISVCIQ